MLNYKNYYNNIIFCLTREAEKGNLPIFFDYRFSEDFVVDVYLPKGLPILEVYGPSVIELKDRITRSGIDTLARKISLLGRIRYLFVLGKNTKKEFVRNYYYDLKIKYLDSDFINSLFAKYDITRYEEFYSDIDNQLQFIVEGKSEKEFLENFTTLFYKDGTKRKTLAIKEEEPEEISNTNEKEFKGYLGDGSQNNCALFVGNGVSIPFGSDSWDKMVDNLLDYLVPYHITSSENIKNTLSNSSYAITSLVKTLIGKPTSRYHDAIRYCIYRKYNPDMHKIVSAIKVISEAKYKYKKLPILTYNYDTFIERQYEENHKGSYLHYSNGEPYDVNDGLALNRIVADSVIHLHGYSSYKRGKTKGIILTDEDYYNAYLDSSSWVRAIQIKMLQNYKCLFVGSSMSDLFQMSLIVEAKKNNKKNRWKCYALMCFKDLTVPEKMKMITYYGNKGIQIIFVDRFDEIPQKLANIFSVII